MDLKRIQAQELDLKSEIEADIDAMNRLSLLLPTTFFMSGGYEMSSCGYDNFIAFYSYSLRMRARFVRFWIDRVYYHDPGVMVPFIEGDENLFRAGSRVHRYVLAGLGLMLIYSAALLGAANRRCRRLSAPPAGNPAAFANMEIEFGSAGIYTVRSYYREFTRHFLAVFYGTSAPGHGIAVGGTVLPGNRKQDFLYLPNPGSIPGDLRAGDLLQLVMRLRRVPRAQQDEWRQGIAKQQLSRHFKELDLADRAGILLWIALAAGCQTVIFDDFIDRIPLERRGELADLAVRLQQRSPVLINLVSSDNTWLDHDRMITINKKNQRYIRL
jgi:hypothetical protein